MVIPTFIGGPRDGGIVPDILWALDKVEMSQRLENGQIVIYFYELDEDSKNYMYIGQQIEDED